MDLFFCEQKLMIVLGFIIVNNAKYIAIIIKDKRQECSV